jgi:hypothetical protein
VALLVRRFVHGCAAVSHIEQHALANTTLATRQFVTDMIGADSELARVLSEKLVELVDGSERLHWETLTLQSSYDLELDLFRFTFVATADVIVYSFDEQLTRLADWVATEAGRRCDIVLERLGIM